MRYRYTNFVCQFIQPGAHSKPLKLYSRFVVSSSGVTLLSGSVFDFFFGRNVFTTLLLLDDPIMYKIYTNLFFQLDFLK